MPEHMVYTCVHARARPYTHMSMHTQKHGAVNTGPCPHPCVCTNPYTLTHMSAHRWWMGISSAWRRSDLAWGHVLGHVYGCICAETGAQSYVQACVDMCTGMETRAWARVWIHLCRDRCTIVCAGICRHVYSQVRVQRCLCSDMCRDMCRDMCADKYTHTAGGWVYRRHGVGRT